MRRVRGAGVTLAVHDDGDPSLPPLVVAHGVGSSSRFVREAFAAPVAAAGFRVVTYDLRGHGASTPVTDPAEASLAHHVSDLAAVADAVGAEVVGGVSLGGHAAVGLAVAGRPLRGVVACLPAWTGRAVPGEGPHAAVAARARTTSVEDMLATMAADAGTPRWLASLLARDWRTHDDASLRTALVALDGAAAPYAADLRALSAPLGVVAWPHDPGHPIAVARDWDRWAPRSRLVETRLAAVGERPERLGTAAVLALLAAGVPAPGQPSSSRR